MSIRAGLVVSTALVCLVVTAAAGQPAAPQIERFLAAASADDKIAKAALAEIAAQWKDSYTPMILDLARLMRGPRRAADTTTEPAVPLEDDERGGAGPGRGNDFGRAIDRGSPIRRRLIAFLQKQTGKSFGDDLNRWREWMWTLPDDPHPDYAAFKAAVYGQIDPRMRSFFPAGARTRIRLDEIDWGGVKVNGIPPLDHPKVITGADAAYLKDSNIVFGIEVGGEARAYPKRILAWHEMARDQVGGVELTIVYCTLCGTVIPYESVVTGSTFSFGTSGLLYRSNKLMFDEQTLSLWNTIEGVPVVGPLADSAIQLRMRAVVTTTWKEWRTEHPATTVLSIDTGFARDYSEGAAYRDYFATDRLMFEVSKKDARLRNKAEVLVMRLSDPAKPGGLVPLAIDVELLKRRPVYEFTAAGQRFVVLTTVRGANRVYRAGANTDANRPDEAARVSAHRAFWFGWYAQFPDTLLIK